MTLAQAVLEIFLFTSFHWVVMRKKEKGANSVIALHNQKFNQVIYTLDTIYDSNIMTIAQAALEIFGSQASIGL